MKNNIIKEFREKFGKASFDFKVKLEDTPLAGNIEQFLLKALKDQRADLLKKIEGMKYFIPVEKGLDILEYRREMKGYKRALRDLEQLLK